MQLYNKLVVPYAATVILELHQLINKQFVVRVFYRNDTTMAEPYQLTLPGMVINCITVYGLNLTLLLIVYGLHCMSKPIHSAKYGL